MSPRRRRNSASDWLVWWWAPLLLVCVALWNAFLAHPTWFLAGAALLVVAERVVHEYRLWRKLRSRYQYEPGVRRSLSPAAWEELKSQSGGRCFYCGKVSGRLEQDHVIPVSQGGSSLPFNFVVACHSCNEVKGAMSAWEFLAEPTPAQLQKLEEVEDLTLRRALTHRERKALHEATKARRQRTVDERRMEKQRKGDEAQRRRVYEYYGWKYEE